MSERAQDGQTPVDPRPGDKWVTMSGTQVWDGKAWVAEVRPDPATRDLLAGILWAYMANERYVTLGIPPPPGIYELTDKCLAALGTNVPPPLPDEPPDGTVLAGVDGQVWQRRDDEPGSSDNWRWWRAGWSDPDHWDDAVKKGADPGRRLVELPDWDDGAAMSKLADAAGYTHRPNLSIVRAVVRALAERGNHGG